MAEEFESTKEYGINDLISDLNDRMLKVQGFINDHFVDCYDVADGTDPDALRNILGDSIHAESICEAFMAKIAPQINPEKYPGSIDVINYFIDARNVAHAFNLRVINYMATHHIKPPF